jgi:hypothetical protein
MRSVLEAVRRWEEKGLVGGDLAEKLRTEVRDHSAAGTQRLFQYVLAATGATVLIIAGGVFLDWAWPQMTEALRTVVLAVVGLAVHLAGTRLESVRQWRPAAYLMQTGGLVLLAVALVYSERAWPDLSAAGIASGVVALAIPVVLGLPSLKRNDVMPAVHLVAGLQFLAIFLDRATPLPDDGVLWVVDAVLLVSMLAMLRLLRTDPQLERSPWALNAFAMSLLAGFVLVTLTGYENDLGDDTIYAVDVWLFLTATATVYGIHRAPEGLRREWFGRQLAAYQLAWIPLGFGSTVGVADGPPEAALVAVAGSGVLGFLYAQKSRLREILAVSAVSFVSGTWYWGVERAGALGAVLALAVTAALLFWYSGRYRSRSAEA